MKSNELRLSVLILIVIASVTFGSQAMAGGETIGKMAEIMMNLNHFPSDSEKQTLREITLNSASSEQEKTIAQAMINLQHAATAEDKKKLSKIVSDDSAPQEVRTLAQIVRDLNHQPSAEDKKKLEDLM